MAFCTGDPNMGLDDAAALSQGRAGSTNCEKTRALNDAAALSQSRAGSMNWRLNNDLILTV
jgi:hypothetical protein